MGRSILRHVLCLDGTRSMKIILINGPPGSGKDTAANLIKRIGSAVVDYKMSKPLKEAFTKLLQIEGSMIPYFLEDHKDEKVPELGGMSPREVQIELSERFCKHLFGEDFFGRTAARAIYSTPAKVVTVSDAGFQVEVAPLMEQFKFANIYLLELHRDECNFDNDSRSYLDHSVFKPQNVAVIQNDFDMELFKAQIERTLTKWNFFLPSNPS